MQLKEAKVVKHLIVILLTIQAVALAGCGTTRTDGYHTSLEQSADERRASNTKMVNWLQDESVINAIVRQKTLFPYHFVPDTPLLTKLGERDLTVLASHYRNNVLPFLTKREILKQVKIFFDYDESAIRTDAIPELDEAIKLLADNPSADLVITGHADVRGSDEYNDALGARRSQAVNNYMAEHQVATARVRIISRGEMDAIAGESDLAGMQQDRNAHFMVAEMQNFPVDLNVKQGGVSNELYSARRKTVRTYLSKQGVDTNLLTLSDGVPGGGGMASPTVLVILTEADDGLTSGSTTSGGN